MILGEYSVECQSQASHLTGENNGGAMVVDPRCGIDDYLAEVDTTGMTIKGVISIQSRPSYSNIEIPCPT